jgi:hypothetical protein
MSKKSKRKNGDSSKPARRIQDSSRGMQIQKRNNDSSQAGRPKNESSPLTGSGKTTKRTKGD